MKLKAITGMLIVAGAALLFIGLRSANRADAAAGDCYSSAQGPSTPTICG
jgi:hypothetical protein